VVWKAALMMVLTWTMAGMSYSPASGQRLLALDRHGVAWLHRAIHSSAEQGAGVVFVSHDTAYAHAAAPTASWNCITAGCGSFES
jgi:hypothetical protein